MADPQLFAKLLSSVGADLGEVWAWLSVEWFACFDTMADIERQKLSCLALTRLCELPEPMQGLVLGKLQDYFSMWTSVVTEVRDNDASAADSLVWPEPPSSPYDTVLDTCENAMVARDPIHTEHTFDFIKWRLQDLIQRAGGELAFEANWAANVDKKVLLGFQALSQPTPRRE